MIINPYIFQSVGGGFDSDAQAFFTATGISDSPTQNAVNDLVIAAKANGWWTKCDVILPLVGGTSTTCAVNLRSPGTFNVVWNGTPTFASTGVSGWGFSNYGETNYDVSTETSLDDNHISVYSRSAGDGNFRDDIFAGIFLTDLYYGLVLNFGGNTRFITSSGSFISGSSSDAQGYFIGTCTGNRFIYKNGSQIATDSSTQSTIPNATVKLGTCNVSNESDKEFAFVTLGIALNSTDATNMYNDIQAFQTALGRNV